MPDIDWSRYRAVILDMDGVITRSAGTHAAAWKRMFDEYLRQRAERGAETFRPFDAEADYYRYVDGKPRYEGAQSFLESRGVRIARGAPEDSPGKETVCGLGNLKNRYFREQLETRGVEQYAAAADWVRDMKRRGKKVAVISSSRNARKVLESAGVIDLFDVVIDGMTARKRHLAGKPEPDIFLAAAQDLEVEPSRAVVIEDALAGVKAGKAGHFGLVIGVDRSGTNGERLAKDADIVVRNFSEISGTQS